MDDYYTPASETQVDLVVSRQPLDLFAATEVMDLKAKNARLMQALHDAINRPMGVVPESTEEFYDYRRVGF